MKRIVWICLGFLALALIALGLLLYFGVLQLNNPSREAYPVRGVDVSRYQGDIFWDVLAEQDIQFAYIKATEGGDFVDPKLGVNLTGAQKTSLALGFYHFFRYETDAKLQADNFARQVPRLDGMMPPAVDVEFYGDLEKNPPKPEDVYPVLDELLQRLEAQYGKKPVIYATDKSYALYIKERYSAYPLWIRSVFFEPRLPEGATWTFWQYTAREKLDGYRGVEPFIDMNAFHGDKQAFREFLLRKPD